MTKVLALDNTTGQVKEVALGTAADANLTSSSTDTTANRVLTVGADISQLGPGVAPLASPIFTGSFRVISNGIELGRVDGTASTAYLDLHSGSTVTDFDARLQSVGGTGVNGNGTLSAHAADFQWATAPSTANSLVNKTYADSKLPLAGGDITGALGAYLGAHGGYGGGNGGSSTWGNNIWGMGAAFDGAGQAETFVPTNMYGMAWLRGSHTNADAQVGEGVYVYQAGNLKGGIGSAGIKTSGVFYGNGSGITNLNASSLSSGTVPDARISGSYSGITTLTISGLFTGARIACTGTGNEYTTGGIEVKGGGGADTVFPTIGFHQPSLYAASLQLRSASDFRFYQNGLTAYADVTARNFNGTLLGSAASLTGYNNPSTSPTASTIAYRDTSGDIQARLLRSTYTNQTDIYGAIAFRGNNGSDNYTRYCSSPVSVRNWLELDDTGWITPALLNGWTSISGRTVQYRKVGNRVMIRGAANNTNFANNNTAAFVVPADYRSSNSLVFSVAGSAFLAFHSVAYIPTDTYQFILNDRATTSGTVQVCCDGVAYEVN